ncbi:MAG: hypothetical protein J6A01_10805 [Proteobacteria bacterium]|nr:hypothetical protein [Pseudomonadota bacterium]
MKLFKQIKRKYLIRLMTVLGFGGMAAFCIASCQHEKKYGPPPVRDDIEQEVQVPSAPDANAAADNAKAVAPEVNNPTAAGNANDASPDANVAADNANAAVPEANDTAAADKENAAVPEANDTAAAGKENAAVPEANDTAAADNGNAASPKTDAAKPGYGKKKYGVKRQSDSDKGFRPKDTRAKYGVIVDIL